MLYASAAQSGNIHDILSPTLTKWGFFYARILVTAMSNQATSEQLYNRYHDAKSSGNDSLMQSYLVLLKNRASWGSSEAQKFVDKIERKIK